MRLIAILAIAAATTTNALAVPDMAAATGPADPTPVPDMAATTGPADPTPVPDVPALTRPIYPSPVPPAPEKGPEEHEILPGEGFPDCEVPGQYACTLNYVMVCNASNKWVSTAECGPASSYYGNFCCHVIPESGVAYCAC